MSTERTMTSNGKVKRIIFICIAAALTVFWVLVIFGFSSATGEESASQSRPLTEGIIKIVQPEYEMPDKVAPKSKDSFYDGITRKCAHVCVYAVLGVLMFLTLKSILRNKRYLYCAFISVPLSIAVAAFDEFNQSLTEGRSGRVYDVLIDFAGIILGTALCVFAIKHFVMNKEKK